MGAKKARTAGASVRFPRAFLVRLSDEDYKALASKADAAGRSLAAEVRRALSRYLRRHA